MSIFSNIKIIYILILFFPVALVTGPFLPDLIISISSIYFILFLLINKNLNYLNNDFVKIFFVFYLFIVIRSFFTDEILFSLKNTLFYIRFLLFAMMLKYLLSKVSEFRKIFPIVFIFTLGLLSIDALIEYQRNTHWLFDKSSYPENDNNRISGLFDEEYILGGFILSFFPTILIIYFFQNQKKKFLKLTIILLTILFSYIVIITGERASFIKLLFLIFSIILFTSIIKTLKKKIIIITSILISIFLIISSQPKLTERLIYHSADLFLQNEFEDRIDRNIPLLQTLKEEYKKGNVKFTYYSKEHTDHAIISLKMFDNKKLFGHGVKMFRFRCGEKQYYINPRSCSTHSHGVALTFLSEIGLMGFAFLLLTYIYLTKQILKSTRNFNIDKVILISILIYLFPLLPSGYFFNNFFSMILFTLIGFYLGYKKSFIKS